MPHYLERGEVTLMQGDPKFVIYVGIDIPAEYTDAVLYRPNPKVKGGVEAYVPQIGEDKEVVQLCVEFPTKPVNERKFRKAMEGLTESALSKARAAGLVLA